MDPASGSSPERATRLILVLCVAAFASSVSTRAIDPMLPAISSDLGVSLREAALLASAYSFPYAIMQLVLGPAGDAVGRSLLIRLSVGAVAVAGVICALAPSFEVAFAARMLAGAFGGGIIPVCLAVVGDRIPLAERQVALSRVLMATVAGQMSGAATAGILAALLSWRAMLGLAAVVATLACVATVLFLDGSGDRRQRLTPRHVIAGYRIVFANPASLLVFAATAGEGLLLYGVFPFVAPLLARHDLAASSFEAGIALAGFAIGGVLYSLFVRRMMGALNQKGMMRAGAVTAGIAYMLVAAPLPWLAIAGLFLIAGFGFYMLHNTLQNQATELAPSARGATFALFSAALFAGQGLGPIWAGAVARVSGFGTIFIVAGAAILLLILYLSRLMKLRG